jgi:hypothetical protein
MAAVKWQRRGRGKFVEWEKVILFLSDVTTNNKGIA